MKPIIKLVLIFAFFCVSCSNDTSDNSTVNTQYLRLNINGVEKIIPSEDYPNNSVVLGFSGNVFQLTAFYGKLDNNYSSQMFKLIFDKNGNIISVKNSVHENEYGDFVYGNYNFFPSNYFDLNIISLDEASKKIKVSFSGNLYLNSNSTSNLYLLSLDREFVQAEGEIDMIYEEWEGPYTGIFMANLEQYCSAKLNGVAWEGNRANEFMGSYTYGSFMASDPYKIEIRFAQDANLGSYNFTTASTENRIKFSKFNTTTLTYDYYTVNGVLNNDYKEFHGGTSYSYFGTYNFTATNPNNPSDVIQVTDGKFRYYQRF